MKISTRGRYAIRVLIDLSEHENDSYIPMKDVAERQSISLKYLGQILPLLSKAKLVEAVQGKGGGYRLLKSPEQCTVGEVLRLTEGDLAPVACLGCESDTCDKKENCKTLPMWQEFYNITNDYFNGVTIADLVRSEATL